MTTIAFQDGKVVMRDDKVGADQACCCCPCGPLNCTVTFSIDGVEFTWNIEHTGEGEVGQEFFVDPFNALCPDPDRYTTIQGCSYCEDGKYRIGVGIYMTSSTDGECYRWNPNLFGPGLGGYANVWYHKARVHILEVSACDCGDVTDRGVQDFEMFRNNNNNVLFPICVAMRGLFVSNTECGPICGDYEGPPDDCQEPPVVEFPVRPWPPECDPQNHEISGVVAECCNEFP